MSLLLEITAWILAVGALIAAIANVERQVGRAIRGAKAIKAEIALKKMPFDRGLIRA